MMPSNLSITQQKLEIFDYLEKRFNTSRVWAYFFPVYCRDTVQPILVLSVRTNNGPTVINSFKENVEKEGASYMQFNDTARVEFYTAESLKSFSKIFNRAKLVLSSGKDDIAIHYTSTKILEEVGLSQFFEILDQ